MPNKLGSANLLLTVLKKQVKLFILICLALIQTYFLLQFIGYNKNTLSKKTDWASVKLIQQLATMGAPNFMLTRNGLFQNQLHLGAWHGYQFLALTQEQSPEEISFDFFLPDAGKLYFMFNINNNQMMGLKLTPPTGGLGFFFKGNVKKGFQSKEYTDLLLTKGWHHFLIKNGISRSEVVLDGVKSNYPFPPLVNNQSIAFQGGLQDVVIDNFKIKDQYSVVIDEDFSYQWALLPIALIFFICLGLQIFAGGVFSQKTKIIAFRLILFNFVFYFCLVPLYLFDYFYWSKTYHYDTYVPDRKTSLQSEKGIERWRQWLFFEMIRPETYKKIAFDKLLESFLKEFTDWDGTSHFEVNVVTQIEGAENVKITQIPTQKFQAGLKKENEFRIGFLGTSQTYGKGASRLEQTMVAEVHMELVKTRPKKRITTYNFSEAGLTSSELLQQFKDKIDSSQLDVLVTNLGFNDPDPDLLKKNIMTIQQHFSKRGTRTLFLSEPTSEDSVSLHHRINIMVLSHLSSEGKIEFWDLAEHMKSEKDSGLLWWDHVHMTSLGQKNVALWLTQKLSPLIK